MDYDAQVPDIQDLLNELEALAPKHDSGVAAKRIAYRSTGDDEIVNDALDDIDYDGDLQNWIDWQERNELPFVYEVKSNEITASPSPITAVDTGLLKLGETEDGLIIALRGTIATTDKGQTTLRLYRTGPIYLRNADKVKILHILGTHLDKSDIFVELDEQGNPQKVKAGVADNDQAYADRFRNWFERILQKIAVQLVSRGIVLLDGALTTNTRDTPTQFFENLRELANQKRNALIGISKQSRLQVQNRAIRFWLAENPHQVCYRKLTTLMPPEMEKRIMGATYAIRFSPMGITYRMDVKPVSGQRESEVIEKFFASCLIRSGYPDLLVQAHAHSYFTSPHVTELKSQCSAKYALRAEPEIDLGGIFGPFGGRFK